MRAARRLIIGGRVQGVGFRYFTQEVAQREGVTGWVQNRADGRVEVYIEGEAATIIRVERALRQGPRSARVDEVDVEIEPPTGEYSEFVIRP
jgi:acylphosphatase